MSNFVGTSQFLNRIMGCHGNHAFSHSPNRFIFRTLFCSKGVVINNLALNLNCPGVQGKLN